jgi:phospholipid/cholesterol/gamma-HCH transport system substrate-binding protein
VRRLERSRLSLAVWGLLGIAVVVLAIVFGFVGTGPVSGRGFELKAILRSPAQLKPRFPVRIAGVDVGEVTSVKPVGPGSDAVEVDMKLGDEALPIHSDASLAIRPRLVFEGNLYVALDPGSPGSGELHSGQTIGVDRTTGPVQLDQVLTDLPTTTRTDLRTVLQGLGQAIGGGDQPASIALNKSLRDAPQALRGLANVTSGLQGEQPHDLSGLVQGTSAVMGALASRQAELSDLITNFDRTMQATASQREELGRSLGLLDPFLKHTDSGLTEVERALPNATLLARELIPGVRQLPSTIQATSPWIDQTSALLGRGELGGVLNKLKPTVRNTATLVQQGMPLLKNLDAIDRCFVQNVLPTGDVVIKDPPLTSGPTVDQEFFQAFTGLASASQNFDGNGHYVRGQTAGGAYPVATSALPQQGSMRGNAVLPPLGTRPAYPGAVPPINFNADCASNSLPDLNSAATGGTP